MSQWPLPNRMYTAPDGKLPTIEEGEELTDAEEKEEEEETEQEVDYHEGRLKQYEFGAGPPRKTKRKTKRRTKRKAKRRTKRRTKRKTKRNDL